MCIAVGRVTYDDDRACIHIIIFALDKLMVHLIEGHCAHDAFKGRKIRVKCLAF